jgi:hypothetical protein
LIAFGLELGDEFKQAHAIILQQKRRKRKGGDIGEV